MRGSELKMSDVEALAAACAGGHADKVEVLLEKGASRSGIRVGTYPPSRVPRINLPAYVGFHEAAPFF